MNIIVNADDYGLTEAVNLGIAQGIKNGVVTSTTMMANGFAFEHGAELYKQAGNFKVGVHLNLTWGVPLCKGLKTLVSEDGGFRHRSELFGTPDQFDPAEIKQELMAQIEKVRAAGIEITHLDSHHHAHKTALVAEIVADIANDLKLPVRPVTETAQLLRDRGVETPEYFTKDFYEEQVSEETFINLISAYESGTLEIMCHPAYIDQALLDATAYNAMRERELEVLCSKTVKQSIEEKGIRLVNYSDYRD